MDEQQEIVEQFCQEYNLASTPEVAALDLQSEVGELTKEILKSTDYGRSEPQYRGEIGDELGDVFFSLLNLANLYDIDLGGALEATLEKYKERLSRGGAGSEFE